MLVGSGIAISIRRPGYMAMLAARSGLSVKQGIVLANAVGIVDSDYQDEIRVPLRHCGDKPHIIKPGDRICQLLIVPIMRATLRTVEEFSAETARGTGGFGSTGQT